MRPVVFMDRDGVLVTAILRSGTAGSPRDLGEFRIEPEAPRAVHRLDEAGFAVVVVTNQPDIARGLVSAEAIDAQNALIRERLAVDAVLVCPHDRADDCDCRKPRPGLLLEATRDLDLELEGSWMVGDRWVDLVAAEAAGVAPLLLLRPWSWDATSAGPAPDGLRSVRSAATLLGCVDTILATGTEPGRRSGR